MTLEGKIEGEGRWRIIPSPDQCTDLHTSLANTRFQVCLQMFVSQGAKNDNTK